MWYKLLKYRKEFSARYVFSLLCFFNHDVKELIRNHFGTVFFNFDFQFYKVYYIELAVEITCMICGQKSSEFIICNLLIPHERKLIKPIFSI